MAIQKIVSILPVYTALASLVLSSDNSSYPHGWANVQQDVAYLLGATWVPKKTLNLSALNLMFEKNVAFIASSPSVYFLAAVLLRKKIIYVCWGMPSKESGLFYYLKLLRLVPILRLSRLVLVNDLITLKNMKQIGVETAYLFPYVVDSSFFYFASYSDRKDIVLVPGDNDRDEHLIQRLSSILPFPIIRVTRSLKVLEYHAKRSHPNLTILDNISFAELRELYQSSRVVLLPIKSENHAAGQTSALEAISCGTPVIISSSRTSSIFEQYEAVSVVRRTAMADLWMSTIDKMLLKISNNPDFLKESSCKVHKVHSPSNVASRLKDVIENVK